MGLEITGFRVCPIWLRKKYREACNFICMECKKSESEVGILQIHRLKRGNKGGLYTLVPLNSKGSNVRVVCLSCHKKFHFKEQGCGK